MPITILFMTWDYQVPTVQCIAVKYRPSATGTANSLLRESRLAAGNNTLGILGGKSAAQVKMITSHF